MALHAYKAMDAGGRLVSGRMEATNMADLEARLRRMELDLIDARAVGQRGFGGRRVGRRELIAFCLHLDQLLQAGVPIIDGLADLRDSTGSLRFRAVLADLVEHVAGGGTLSQALARHPQAFDDVFASLVAAGEATGNLPRILHNLAESLKWQDELAAQTKRLAIYPAFLGAVVVLVTLFMMLYLVPRVAAFIGNMGQELPWHTQLLIATSDFLVGYWPLALGLPLLAFAALVVAARVDERVRARLDAARLALPWLGGLVRKTVLARFAGVFAMMYASGIPVLEAIRAGADVAGNRVIRRGLRRAAGLIAEGQGLSAAFQNVGLFPPLVIRMLRVGESTGALDAALTHVSYFYNRDVREAVARLQALVEPALTIFVGAILGWVMLAVLGPIYDTITRIRL